MANRSYKNRGSQNSSIIKLPIYSLSGGVSTQAESKRLPTEASQLDNVILSIEKSVEKRSGYTLLTNDTFTGDFFFTQQAATFTKASYTITVTKQNHNYAVGSLISITFEQSDVTNNQLVNGNYNILTKTDDTFTILTLVNSTLESRACTILGANIVPTSEQVDLIDLKVLGEQLTATYAQNNSSIVVTKNAHGLLVGNCVDLEFINSVNINSTYKIISRTSNDFTVTAQTTNPEEGDGENNSCLYQKDTDYYFYWLNVNTDNCFLIVIDYSSSYESDNLYQKLIYVYKINQQDNTWTNLTPSNQSSTIVSTTTRNYITYNNQTSYAKDVLKISAIGSNLIVLNTTVKAGFTSGSEGMLFNLDGTLSQTPDIDGRKLTYYTSARYTLGANSNWYLNKLSPITAQVYGIVSVNNTVTLSKQPELPLPVTHGVPFSISKVVPAEIVFSDKTNLSIHGNGFLSPSSVSIGSVACLDVVVQSAELITCKAPSLELDTNKDYNIVVTSPSGGASSFTSAVIIPARQLATYSRLSGSASNLLITTATAHNCVAGSWIYLVTSMIGLLDAATVYYKVTTLVSATQFYITPSVALAVGSTGAVSFSKLNQIVTTIFPSTVATSSATSVILTGRGFISNASNVIKVGTVTATSIVVKDDTQLSCSIPAGLVPGTYDLTFSNSIYGTSYVIKNLVTVSNTEVVTATQETVRPNTKTKFYIIGENGQWAVLDGWNSEVTQYGIGTKYNVNSTYGGTITSGETVTLYSGYYPPVEDLSWNDMSEKYLGQSMTDFNDIRFPPDSNDYIANNGINFLSSQQYVGTYTKASYTITVTLGSAHGIIVGENMFITFYLASGAIDNNITGRYTVASVPTSLTFTVLSDYESTVTTPNYVSYYREKVLTSLDNKASLMLASLYPKDGLLINNTATGLGKIYFCAGPYLNFTTGYYRIISSAAQPYTKKIRSPDSFSVIDKRRLPQKIELDFSKEIPITFRPIDWLAKTSGDRYTNPGPSVFLSTDSVTPQQVNINSITTFRDRLYLCAKDVLFTSVIGQYENLFIEDSSNLTASDPIDIKASSTSFNEIKTLTPFNNFLFLTTHGNVQYELKGSVNQITPLTAEISPTAFYSTITTTEPQTLGTFIYFLDSSKLYLYISTENKELAIAKELTSSCYNYLPSKHQFITTAPAQDTLILVDAENLNTMYFNISRFSNDRAIQNAFYRHIINVDDSFLSSQVYSDYMYSVIQRKTTSKISNNATNIGVAPDGDTRYIKNKFYIEKMKMTSDENDIPRLDRMISLRLTSKNSEYNAFLNTTIIRVPISTPYETLSSYVLVLKSGWSTSYDMLGIAVNRNGEIASPTTYKIFDDYIEFTFSGSYVPTSLTGTAPNTSVVVNYDLDCRILIGIKYLMTIELSKQFVRDQNNNVINGLLSLKKIILKHHLSGNYDVAVNVSGRDLKTNMFSPFKLSSMLGVLSLNSYETDGKFQSNILGASDKTTIKILSEYTTPLNIVNIEIYGKFTQKNDGNIF